MIGIQSTKYVGSPTWPQDEPYRKYIHWGGSFLWVRRFFLPVGRSSRLNPEPSSTGEALAGSRMLWSLFSPCFWCVVDMVTELRAPYITDVTSSRFFICFLNLSIITDTLEWSMAASTWPGALLISDIFSLMSQLSAPWKLLHPHRTPSRGNFHKYSSFR